MQSCFGQSFKQVPRFVIGVIASGLPVVTRIDEQTYTGMNGGDRNDVPTVLGDDVDGEKVHLGRKIGDWAERGAASTIDVKQPAADDVASGFDLDAREATSARSFKQAVVAQVVAVWLENVEAERRCAKHETEFRDFSGLLGVAWLSR